MKKLALLLTTISVILFPSYTTSIASEIDDARLLKANQEAKNWLTYSQGFHNQRHSKLTQINRENAGKLVPKWIYQTGVKGSFQTNPLVVDGKMYISTPFNHVVALDAATGKELWRYKHKLNTKKVCCGSSNRGIAINYGKIYMITIDARLLALDIKDGSIIWDMPVADPNSGKPETVASLNDGDYLKKKGVEGWTGFTGNMAPMVFDNKVIVGVSGAGYGLHLDSKNNDSIAVVGLAGKQIGLRAFLSAYDATTGKLLWRWYSTDDKNWEGKFVTQTPDGNVFDRNIAEEKKLALKYKDGWRRGGGSVWTHPAFDPELGLLYIGTGNPAPQLDGYTRPGDNLYTVSLVAIDVNTGKLKWYYQQVPHDVWGYDVASPPVLFDIEKDGQKIPVVSQASKIGFLFVHDRRTGKLIKKSKQFVSSNNMFKRPTRAGIVITPGAAGGTNWSPTSYNPLTKRVYVPAMHMPTLYKLHDLPKEKQGLGKTYGSLEIVKGAENYGLLNAINPATGEIDWQVKTDQPLLGGLVTTAGKLIFMGESNGHFTARDLDNGKLLWKFQTGAGVNAPPVTYEVNGKQFVAVAAGGNQIFRTPGGNAIIAFGLAE